MLKWLLCMCLCTYFTLEAYSFEAAYTAKAIDYAPTYDNTPAEIMQQNIRNVIMELEKYSSDDIAVFPEYAITGIKLFSHNNISEYAVDIPKVDRTVGLCRNFSVHKIIQDVACGMVQPQAPKYLVLNMLEKENSDIYNTNVMFEKATGAIVAKYRKINLNEETEKGRLTAGKEVVVYPASDLGITFGIITSDDIFHKTPAQDIFHHRNVTDVIITSAWRSELPFYTTVGLHSGYAKKNGINLIASSLSDPATGRGSSGLYTPASPDLVYIPKVPGTQTKTAKMPLLSSRQPQLVCNKKINPRSIGALPDIEAYKTRITHDINEFTMKPLLQTENDYSFSEEICKGKMCCKFVISYNKDIFNIQPVYKVATSNNACGLIVCDSENDPTSCASRSDDLQHAFFNNITITVKVKDKEAYQYQPVASNRHLLSFDYTFCDDSESITLTATAQSDVVFFGVIMGGSASAGHTLAGFGFLWVFSLIIALQNFI